MRKLLIADEAEVFSAVLSAALSGDYTIAISQTGDETLRILEDFRPDALVISLSLPYHDGLSVLRQTDYRPPVILATTNLETAYTIRSAQEVGVGFLMTKPCDIRCVISHLEEMFRQAEQPKAPRDPYGIVENHLTRLGIAAHRNGFAQLRAGIPLFAEDDRQLMKEELYTSVAAICGNSNPQQVERSIREAIKKAWKDRDCALWEEYFPNCRKAPSNKKFIAVLAWKLRQEMEETNIPQL